jgi:hypothetical protein
MSQRDDVRRVKELHKANLLATPNVTGVGFGYKDTRGERTDEVSVKVLVQRKVPRAGLTPEALIPPELDGVRTDVIQVGYLRAFQARTDRWRPALGGVSLGHYQITAGTFGTVVRDRATNDRLILSNNHVLANSNDASIGDPILQPGAADGGAEPEDTIARLERFHPIQFNVEPGTCNVAISVASVANVFARLMGSTHRLQAFQSNEAISNLVDAAVARPLGDDLIQDEILDIGVVQGTAQAALSMSVRKSGRSTGLTTGEIVVLDATVNVSYGEGRTVLFEDQIVTGPMSAPGDSGSLLVAGDALQAVGLLFAGSDDATIYNPIQTVLDLLDITL